MCGIAVSISFDGRPADQQALERMGRALAHRGPDESAIATYGSVGFAFRRLAILDLTAAGHQPMETTDGRLSIVFNGEIYNYIELKKELEQLGHTFRSTCDTEVLLLAYRQWGEDCVSRLNGMWAFAIYNKAQRTLFVSRDRFGVKPLYRFQNRNTLLLASEIKGIVASGLYAPETNWRATSKFLLRNRLDDDCDTFFCGVDQVPPGTSLEIQLDGRIKSRRYWALPSATPAHEEIAAPEQTVRELLRDSVRLRMRSDVPIGVCLSGGIDSSAIISLMAAMRPPDATGRLQAFSYIPEEFSEAAGIQLSIERTGAELNELVTTPQQLWDILPRAMWHHDGPVHSPTALVGFELMRLARSRGVKVVLNGQGADEVWAGYPYFFQHYWSDLVRRGRLWRASREISAFSHAHSRSTAALWRVTAAKLLRRSVEGLPGYRALVRERRLSRLYADPWYTNDLVRKLDAPDLTDRSMNFERILRHSVQKNPLPLYLRIEDRNSMAHSVEARLPFLDYRLVSLAFSLGPEWKLRGPWNKYIVREATKGLMAESVRTRRDKMGFPTPSSKWFANAWYQPVRDLLASQSLRESGLVNVARVEHDLERHRTGETDTSRRLFRVVQLGLWLQGLGEHDRPVAEARRPLPSAVRVGGRSELM
jgi:asparagine synthase (glutamine-hydrolysing)